MTFTLLTDNRSSVAIHLLQAAQRLIVAKKWGQLLEDACIREEIKVFSDTAQDQQGLLRFITTTKLSARPAWQQHSQILAQKVEVVESGGDLVTLKVSGYVKSKGITPDQLIHIPSFGTYQLKAIGECLPKH